MKHKNFFIVPNQIFELCKRVANGEAVKGERKGYSDIAIFKNGVTL